MVEIVLKISRLYVNYNCRYHSNQFELEELVVVEHSLFVKQTELIGSLEGNNGHRVQYSKHSKTCTTPSDAIRPHLSFVGKLRCVPQKRDSE